MSIYEYNEEYVKKSLYEEGEECGIFKSVEAAMRNFHISLKEACEGLETTVEEYGRAKNLFHEA